MMQAEQDLAIPDPFGIEASNDPTRADTAIREAGPVVWLARHRVWATGRHHLVQQVLHDPARFSSADGTGMVSIHDPSQLRKPSPVLDATLRSTPLLDG